MADMLGIGVSGLKAYQRALQTVSHNVTNANTEGYSRQRIEFGTQIPQYTGSGYIGNGVQTESIKRVYDDFLAGQVTTYTSSASHAEVYSKNVGLIDEMLADPDIGLSPVMDGFFQSYRMFPTIPHQSLCGRHFFLRLKPL